MRRRAPHIWLRDEILRPVAAVASREGGLEYWAIKPAGRLGRFRRRRRMPREEALRELRARRPSSGQVFMYPDDGPTGPLSPR